MLLHAHMYLYSLSGGLRGFVTLLHVLFSQQPDVRLKCVLGLQGLYQDVNLSSKMDLFSSRFKVPSAPSSSVVKNKICGRHAVGKH